MQPLWIMITGLLMFCALPAFAQTLLPKTMDVQLERLHQKGQYHGRYHGARSGIHSEVPMDIPPAPPVNAAPASGSAPMKTGAPAAYHSMIDSTGSGAIDPLPLEIETYGHVTYISGGISDEEVNMLKTHGGEFNLHVLINTAGGGYLVASNFHVMDSTGLEVLRINNAGPYIYAQLAPGTYMVEAVEGSEIKNTRVTVPTKGFKQVQLTFQPQEPSPFNQ